MIISPIKFRAPNGSIAYGYDAEGLTVGVHYAWVLPQMEKAIVARQPSDDLAIPPVPFNALRYSR
ncbi:MAG: hypothetical protein WAN65_10805 [Candidatus Sulfotelmatobacter sp.]